MLYLTVGQHQAVVQRIVALARGHADRGIPIHSAGLEYTSLMLCFLLHNLSAAETHLRVSSSFTDEWFPVTIGYALTRTMFEMDITAHYITQEPTDRSRQYIEFAAVLNKHQLDACLEHKGSKDPQWQEAMSHLWQHRWAPRQADVQKEFAAVVPKFTRKNRNGKDIVFQNWSGKTSPDGGRS